MTDQEKLTEQKLKEIIGINAEIDEKERKIKQLESDKALIDLQIAQIRKDKEALFNKAAQLMK